MLAVVIHANQCDLGNNLERITRIASNRHRQHLSNQRKERVGIGLSLHEKILFTASLIQRTKDHGLYIGCQFVRYPLAGATASFDTLCHLRSSQCVIQL